MILKGDSDNKVFFGSTLSNDGFQNDRFDFILTNPPYGKSWKTDQDKLAVGKKKEIVDARFQIGTPRINDGQLLFMLHMLSKMKHDTPLGTRIASVHNGSALFTGDAGSGESEIRKHIIENDYLEAIIALPKDMFYNTGIGTYIWILTNRKPKNRQGKIQLINATGEEFFAKMTKSLGNKRNELKPRHIDNIYQIYQDFKETKTSKIFDNTDFGYTQIIVERPKKDESGKAILKKGKMEADSELRDKENIPLKQNIEEYFKREVLPFAPDAWISDKERKVGYEINFNKYFYEYTPPRGLEEIKKDILALEQETDGILKEIIA
jgi:type I restriction enzyme M protein